MSQQQRQGGTPHMQQSVDNFEDNCVENIQIAADEWPTWMQHWITQITQPPFLSCAITPAERAQLQQAIADILLANQMGDSCTQLSDAARAALLPLSVQVDETASDSVLAAKPFVLDEDRAYLYRYWQLEQRLAQHVARLVKHTCSTVDVQPYLELLVNPAQRAALEMVATQGFAMITGGPGTGKTYTLARIIAVLNHVAGPLRIALAAPTGKAAQRMQEALQFAFHDPHLQQLGLVDAHLQQQRTQTLHRLLGLGHQQGAKFNAQQPLPYDVIVIDEASMLDLELATLLFEAVASGCRLILLGDAQQLASVGVGSVLADLQRVPRLATHHVHLTESHRFSDQAQIGRLAQFIQAAAPSQDEPDSTASESTLLARFEQAVQPVQGLAKVDPNLWPADKIDEVRLQYLSNEVQAASFACYTQLFEGYHAYVAALQHYMQQPPESRDHQAVIQAFDRYRVLVAIRHGALGLNRLNQWMSQALQKALTLQARGEWFLGRPVMMLYNEYQLGLSNGDIGVCLYHPEQPDQYAVYFASLDQWVPAARLPSQIETAFALTIHKSQGSEFQHVAVVLDQAAERLLSQELLYTAITRAKKVVSLLVHPQALAQSLMKKTIRQSGLSAMLRHRCRDV